MAVGREGAHPTDGVLRLQSFLDLDDLVCNLTMGLAVYRLSGFFVWRLDQAENLSGAFVEPILQVLNPILMRVNAILS